MHNQEYISEFDTLITNFITNKALISKIYENIAFTKKHVEQVDSYFDETIEKRIAYRELGSIVYSCIEAILKGAIATIDKRCTKNNCSKKCRYRFDLEAIDDSSFEKVFSHLKNVRLIDLIENDNDELMKLADLRNYVHISKHILNVNKDDLFNKDYVDKMFDFYYEFIDQLNMQTEYYFQSKRYLCLKEADGNDYKLTEESRKIERKSFYRYKLFCLLDEALLGKDLSYDDIWYISRLDYSKFINLDEVIMDITNRVEYLTRRADNPKEKKEEMLHNLTKYLKHKAIIDKIKAI